MNTPTPTQPFQWTDELVKKFANELFADVMADDKVIAAFKSSHSTPSLEGKGWEVADWDNSEVTKDSLRVGTMAGLDASGMLARAYKIKSVKRVSDGVVFSIGDGMTYPGGKDMWSTGKYCIIEHFSIQDGQLYVNSHFAGKEEGTITDWIKAPSPEEKPSVKPPIGIMPEWLWKEKRLQDLQAAIKRYLLESQEPIPLNWIAEEYCLREWIENRNEEKRTQGGKD